MTIFYTCLKCLRGKRIVDNLPGTIFTFLNKTEERFLLKSSRMLLRVIKILFGEQYQNEFMNKLK